MDSVLQIFRGNAEKAVELITAAVPKIAERAWDDEKKKLKVCASLIDDSVKRQVRTSTCSLEGLTISLNSFSSPLARIC